MAIPGKVHVIVNKQEINQNMSSSDRNNASMSSDGEYGSEHPLVKVLSSDTWMAYFHELASSFNVELSAYDSEGEQIFLINESPFCKFKRSLKHDMIDCPSSCNIFIQSDEPHAFRCRTGQACFSFPVDYSGERGYIVIRGGFASYDDLLAFLTLLRDNNLPAVPMEMPIPFIDEGALKSVSTYVELTVNRQIRSLEDTYRLEEKYLRITTLFDSQAFGTLSKKPELMYRYVLDTIEFVFGRTSAVLMTLDEKSGAYRTVHSIGTSKDVYGKLSFSSDNALIRKISDVMSTVFVEDLDSMIQGEFPEKIESSYFIPVVTGGRIDALIGIFNKEMSREDLKVLNAFREYVQLNLENQSLRVAVSSNKRSDEKIAYLSDITKSIVSILDKETLLSTLLEKSLELLNAEQGSLMILDHETSELVVEARKSVDDTVREKMRFRKEEGISGMVLEKGGAILVADIEKDPRTRQVNRPRYRTKSFLSVPIKIDDRLAGVLNVSDKLKGTEFNNDDLTLIEAFITNVAIAIERSLLYRQTEKLQKLSITDPLTGIYNRRYLNRRLSEEITRYNRYKHPFSFMMLDLDKFKEYNDTFGHVAGDNLIRKLAHTMEKSLRTIDIAARFGGDEFVTIFPQTPKVDAIQISNRLKEQIERSLSEHNVEMPLSISVGLATFPDDASSIMELIEKTDQALYLAKKGGGNRVVYL